MFQIRVFMVSVKLVRPNFSNLLKWFNKTTKKQDFERFNECLKCYLFLQPREYGERRKIVTGVACNIVESL